MGHSSSHYNGSMIHGIHAEPVLAGGCALLLGSFALTLEWLARRSLRRMKTRLGVLLESEPRHFHCGLCLALLLLAALILLVELFKYKESPDGSALFGLLVPIVLTGSRYFELFVGSGQKSGRPNRESNPHALFTHT